MQHALEHFPTPQATPQLSLAQFQHFAQQHHHYQQAKILASFAQLLHPHPQPDPVLAQVYQTETLLLVKLLHPLVQSKQDTQLAITHLYQNQPDFPIFASLPGLGPRLGPALLSKFGDDRRCFPTATALQALAGTCPVTHHSGKRKSVRFRWACDRHFRHIAQQWAANSNQGWSGPAHSPIRTTCRRGQCPYPSVSAYICDHLLTQ